MANESLGAMAVKNGIENSIKKVTSGPTKEKIPPENIIVMLTNETRRKEVMPLLEDVLVQISNIDGLDDAISKLLKEKQNEELTAALKKLQDKLRSFYTTTYKTGGKRRKSKKRNYYKKRRTSKYR